MAANTREGYRSEALARFALSAFGPATDVEVEDDHGIDLLCATATVVDKRLRVGESYLVQVKSELAPICFSGPHCHTWLASLGSPLMIAVVDKDSARVRLFSTWNLSRFLMQQPAWGTDSPSTVTLLPGESASNPPSHDAIGLGPPIVDFVVADLADDALRGRMRDCIAESVRVEHQNLARRKVGLTFAIGYSQWKPNAVPEPIHLIRENVFGAKGVETARRIIGDAAALIAFVEKRGGGKPGERDALATYLRTFVDPSTYDLLWEHLWEI